MEISLHVLEDEVEIFIVLGLNYFHQLNNIFMPLHLLQKYYLPEGSLGIG